jgi:hypothetical protein
LLEDEVRRIMDGREGDASGYPRAH